MHICRHGHTMHQESTVVVTPFLLLTLFLVEFEDWEEEKPLIEPKFVWTAPHDSKKMSLFHKPWDSYSEFSSRAGSVMSVGSFVFETNETTGVKTGKGMIQLLRIFPIRTIYCGPFIVDQTRANVSYCRIRPTMTSPIYHQVTMPSWSAWMCLRLLC